MYFKQKSNIMFRNYRDFAYLTDNRNFGYKQLDDNENNDIGDRIISQSGAIFLSALDKNPRTLDDLVRTISSQFTDVDIETLKVDVKDFYCNLESDGFIVSGETLEECIENDFKFSYSEGNPKNRIFENSTKDFFDEYFNGEPQLTNLHMEITAKCNERCIHCYIPHNNKINHIESELFYSILEQCKEMNLLHLTLSGGEPMLHNNFIDFLKKCNEYNFSVNVLSNLTLLNDEILDEMKNNKLLSVQVSLYSMNPDIHDSITQLRGSFEKTKNAILKLKDNNIPLQISCPIMKQNITCYNDVIDWGKSHNFQVGSDYVIIARYDHSTQNLNNRLSTNDIEMIFNQRMADNPDYLKFIEKESENKQNILPDDFVCSVCHSSICIAENGNVYPCAGWQDYVIGNAKETAIKYIWDNSVRAHYLRNLRKKDFPKCLQCPENDICTMCMVRNANEHPLGDPLIVNEYFCSIEKLHKKMIVELKSYL